MNSPDFEENKLKLPRNITNSRTYPWVKAIVFDGLSKEWIQFSSSQQPCKLFDQNIMNSLSLNYVSKLKLKLTFNCRQSKLSKISRATPLKSSLKVINVS